MSGTPQLLFVAGPNGAGKSTFSKAFSNPGAIIFDVDIVSFRIEAKSPGMPKKQVYQVATQEFFNQATDAVRRRQDFTLETSFRDEPLLDIVARFKQFGYTTNMIYLALENIEKSATRVKERVLNGGHYVDQENILLNYRDGLQHLERFADHFDNLEIYNASKNIGELESLLKVENKQLVHLNNELPIDIAQVIISIADRYRNKPRDYGLGR